MIIQNAEVLPIQLVPYPASPVGGTDSVVLTITVDSAPVGNTTVQIDCGDQSLLVSPSSSWPYQVPVASGETTASVTLQTNSVASSTSVQVRGGSATANMANSSDWTATAVLTIGPSQPSPG